MANGNEESGATPQRVLELFKAGRSKADIARELGKDREWVKNALAKAIRGIPGEVRDIYRAKPAAIAVGAL